MQVYWLCNQENLKNFQIYWATSSQNTGDYNKKHHQVVHHCAIFYIYLHIKTNNTQEQGIHIWIVDTEGPQTAHAAAFLAEALNSTEFHMCTLCAIKSGNIFRFVP